MSSLMRVGVNPDISDIRDPSRTIFFGLNSGACRVMRGNLMYDPFFAFDFSHQRCFVGVRALTDSFWLAFCWSRFLQKLHVEVKGFRYFLFAEISRFVHLS